MPRLQWSFLMLPEDHKEVKWALSFIDAKLTVWGQIIFGLILVGIAISSVGTQVAAYYFVSLVWALFISSLFLTTFFKPTVVAKRYLPSNLKAGGVCLYRVVVTNIGKKPLRNLEIFAHKLPFGLYSQPKNLNQKTSADWLEPGKSAVLTLALRTPRRGSFILKPLLAATSFPTGLIRSLKKVAGENSFIVFPKLLKIENFELLLKHQFQPGGTHINSRFGSSNEFLSTREYRQGDRVRDIHWNSSARLGKLIVKEHTDEYFVRVGLFLDTELTRFEKHLCFEGRISLCAGLAEDFFNKNYLVDLYLSEIHSPVVQVGGRRDQFSHLLEILSAIEGQDHVDFSYAVAKIKEQAHQMSGLVLFIKDWDDRRAVFVQTIKELNIPTKILIIRDKPLSLSVNDPSISIYTPKELGYTL